MVLSDYVLNATLYLMCESVLECERMVDLKVTGYFTNVFNIFLLENEEGLMRSVCTSRRLLELLRIRNQYKSCRFHFAALLKKDCS